MQQNPLLIHIGYHKTATTWLQKSLFENAEAGFARPISSHEAIMKLVGPNSFDFEAYQCGAVLLPKIKAAREQGLSPVLSTERLSGLPWYGGYDSKELSRRLAAVFPGARILIVIREQKSMLLSNYNQYIKHGGMWPIQQFLTPPFILRMRATTPTFSLGGGR